MAYIIFFVDIALRIDVQSLFSSEEYNFTIETKIIYYNYNMKKKMKYNIICTYVVEILSIEHFYAHKQFSPVILIASSFLCTKICVPVELCIFPLKWPQYTIYFLFHFMFFHFSHAFVFKLLEKCCECLAYHKMGCFRIHQLIAKAFHWSTLF